MLSASPTCLLLCVQCVVAVHYLPLHLLFELVDDLRQAVVGLQDLSCGKT